MSDEIEMVRRICDKHFTGKHRCRPVSRWLKDRASYRLQSVLWLFGVSWHNTVRDECTPDFSCCRNAPKRTLRDRWNILRGGPEAMVGALTDMLRDEGFDVVTSADIASKR